MRIARLLFVLGMVAGGVGCTSHIRPDPENNRAGGGGSGGSDPGGSGGAGGGVGSGAGAGGATGTIGLEVSGQVVDFETGAPVATGATLQTALLMPAPKVSVTGADFVVGELAANATFFLVASGPPDHVPTYNPETVMQHVSLTGVQAETLSQVYLSKLDNAFEQVPQLGTAIVIVHAIDATTGAGMAGLDGGKITLGPGPKNMNLQGPFYLDANKQPRSDVDNSTAGGWLVFYDVPPGTVQIMGGGGFMVSAPPTPAVANAVSLIEAVVTKGK